MTTRKTEKIGATEIRNGDIIFTHGYRCRASQCSDSIAADGTPVRSFVLTSEPDALNTDTLPGYCNGGVFGGSALATYGRELVPHNG